MDGPGLGADRPLIEAGRVLARRFRADVLLGRGGMGEVWRCHDLDQTRDVAVKVVRPEVTAEAWAAKLFHGEVVAMARLAHPACIPIYDFLDEPGLGSFFVMEFRPGGRPLRQLVDRAPPWPVLRALFDEILSGLAYAHAKGVLHLDIKPENVLVQARGTLLRPTILDFGISRVRHAGVGIERWSQGGEVLGTVSYMAPEQLSGEVGRMGRWTDLYALGTMIYEIVAGRLPFRSEDPVGMLLAQLTAPPPALVPRAEYADVPERFCALVDELLAAEPRARPRFAADVRAALRGLGSDGARAAPAAALALGDPSPGAHMATSGDPLALWLRAPAADAPAPGAPTKATQAVRSGPEALEMARTLLATPLDLGAVLRPATARGLPLARDAILGATGPLTGPGAALGETGSQEAAAAAALASPTGAARIAASSAVQAMAEVADAEEIARSEEEPPAAGSYGLYGLRDLPLLGRFSERQATWEVVRDAFAQGLPRVVLLEGGAGVGKSRLARDVIERGEQMGLLEGMQTWWSARGSSDEGLRGLVENTLDCRGAETARVEEQLAFWLEGLEGDHHYFARDTRVFLRPPAGVELDRGLPMRVAVELVERAALRRPVLLWLDDVQWGRDEGLALMQKLLAHAPALSVCVVASVRSDEPAPEGWEALCAHERVRRVPMAQLDLEATRVFVRGLLDVDDQLCHFIAGRAEGNPLFAAQLLHQLVEADALERRQGRYGLATSFDLAQVPANIDALWAQRVARAAPGERERQALCTMALVRDRLSGELVRALEAVAGEDAQALEAARRAALAAGLAREEEGTLAWTHGLLREHLVRALPEPARPVAHLRAARALEALRALGEDVDYERALHLRGAQDDESAVQALRASIDYSRARSRIQDLSARAELLLDWSATLKLQSPGPHRALALVHLARLDHLQGRLDDAARRLAEALEAAGPAERLEVLNQDATLLTKQGRIEEALAKYEQLEREAVARGDRVAEGRGLFGKGKKLRELGRIDESTGPLARARAAFAEARDERLEAYVIREEAMCELWRGNLVAARAALDRAHTTLARLGDAQGELVLEQDLAAWCQAGSDLDAMIAHMQRALKLAEALGLAYLIAGARVNLALAEATRGDYRAVADHLQAVQRIEGGLRSADIRTTHGYVLVEVAATVQPSDTVEASLARAIAHQRDTAFLDPDLPRSIERASRHAEERGLAGLRAALIVEAVYLWGALGRYADVERLQQEQTAAR